MNSEIIEETFQYPSDVDDIVGDVAQSMAEEDVVSELRYTEKLLRFYGVYGQDVHALSGLIVGSGARVAHTFQDTAVIECDLSRAESMVMTFKAMYSEMDAHTKAVNEAVKVIHTHRETHSTFFSKPAENMFLPNTCREDTLLAALTAAHYVYIGCATGRLTRTNNVQSIPREDSSPTCSISSPTCSVVKSRAGKKPLLLSYPDWIKSL